MSDKKPQKWVYSPKPLQQIKAEEQQKRQQTSRDASGLMAFLDAPWTQRCIGIVFLACIAVVPYVFYQMLQASNLSNVEVVIKQPVMVGFEYKRNPTGGGKSSNHFSQTVVTDRYQHHYVIHNADLPLAFPHKGQYRTYVNGWGQDLINQQTLEPLQAYMKVEFVRALVYGRSNSEADTAIHNGAKLYPIEMVYWHEGEKRHFKRPVNEYQRSINAQCSDCMAERVVLQY